MKAFDACKHCSAAVGMEGGCELLIRLYFAMCKHEYTHENYILGIMSFLD